MTCLTIDEISHDIAVNASGFDYPDCVVNMYRVIGGKSYGQTPISWAPISWWRDGACNITRYDAVPEIQTAVQLKRWLVMNGAKNPSPSDDWNVVAKWQLLGQGAGNETILFTVTTPCTLHVAVDMAIELFSPVNLGDLDSGRSVNTKVGNDIIRGDEVANFLAFMIKQESKPMADVIGNPDGARAFLAPNKGKLIGKLPQGLEVSVLGVADNWTQIKRPWHYDNQTTNSAVWVLTADVSFAAVEPPPTEPPPSGSPVTAAGAFQLDVGGVTYVNRDEIVWVVE